MLLSIFYAFALLTVGSALIILLTKNVLYAAFSLLLTFLGVAGLYVLAGADFLAITQVMIYVGGILVLMIFGVMLTNKDREASPATTQHHNQFLGTLAAIALFTVLLIAILKVNFSALGGASGSLSNRSSVAATGIQLMTGFVLPFEVAAILLMVALISAAYIAGKSKK